MKFFRSCIFVYLYLCVVSQLMASGYKACVKNASADQTVDQEIQKYAGLARGYTLYAMDAKGWLHRWDDLALQKINNRAHSLRSRPLTHLRRGQGYIIKTVGSCESEEVKTRQNLKFLNDGWVLFGFGNPNSFASHELQIFDPLGNPVSQRVQEMMVFDHQSNRWVDIKDGIVKPFQPVLFRGVAGTKIVLDSASDTVELEATPNQVRSSRSISLSRAEGTKPAVQLEAQAGLGSHIQRLYWQTANLGVTSDASEVLLNSAQSSAHAYREILKGELADRIRAKMQLSDGTWMESDWLALDSVSGGWNLSEIFEKLDYRAESTSGLRFSVDQTGNTVGVLPPNYLSARLQSIVVSLSGADFATQSFQFSGFETSARISVPFGNDRRVDLSYFDDSGDLLRKGTKVFNATAVGSAIAPDPVPTGIPSPIASVSSMAFLTSLDLSFSLSENVTGATLVILEGVANPKSLQSTQSLIKVTNYSASITASTTYQIFVEMQDGRRGGTFSYHYVKTNIPEIISSISGLLPQTGNFFTNSAQLEVNSAIPNSRVYYTSDGSTPTLSSANAPAPLSVFASQSTTFRYFVVSPFGYASNVETREIFKTVVPNLLVAFSNSRNDGRFIDSLDVTISSVTNQGFVRIGGQNYSLPHTLNRTQSELIVYEPVSPEGIIGTAISLNLQKIDAPAVTLRLVPESLSNTFVATAQLEFIPSHSNLTLYYTTGVQSPTLSSANVLLPATFSLTDSVEYQYFVADEFGFLSAISNQAFTKLTGVFLNVATVPSDALSYGFSSSVLVTLSPPSGYSFRFTTDSSLPVQDWMVASNSQVLQFFDSVEVYYQILDSNQDIVSSDFIQLTRIPVLSNDLLGSRVFANAGNFSFRIPTAMYFGVEATLNSVPVAYTTAAEGNNTVVSITGIQAGPEKDLLVSLLDASGDVTLSRQVKLVQPVLNSFYESDPFGLRHEYYRPYQHGAIASAAWDFVRNELYFMTKGDGRILRLDDLGILHHAYTPQQQQLDLFSGVVGIPFAVSDSIVYRFFGNGYMQKLVQIESENHQMLTLTNSDESCQNCVLLSDLIQSGDYAAQNLQDVLIDVPYLDINQQPSVYSVQYSGGRLYFALSGILVEVDLNQNTLQLVSGYLPSMIDLNHELADWHQIQDFVVTLERYQGDSLLVSTVTSDARLGFYILETEGSNRGLVTTSWFFGDSHSQFDHNQALTTENFPTNLVNGVNVINGANGPELYLRLENDLVRIDLDTQEVHFVAGRIGGGFSDQIPAKLSQVLKLGDFYSAGDKLLVGFTPDNENLAPDYNYSHFGLADPQNDTISPVFYNASQHTSGLLAILDVLPMSDGVVLLENDYPDYQVFYKRTGVQDADDGDDILLSSNRALSGLFHTGSSGRIYTCNELRIQDIDWLDMAEKSGLGLASICIPSAANIRAYMPAYEDLYFLVRQASGDYVLYRGSLSNPDSPVEKLSTFFSGQIDLGGNQQYKLDLRATLQVTEDSLFIVNEGSLLHVSLNTFDVQLVHLAETDSENHHLGHPVKAQSITALKQVLNVIYVLSSEQMEGSVNLGVFEDGHITNVMRLGHLNGFSHLYPDSRPLRNLPFHNTLSGILDLHMSSPQLHNLGENLLVLENQGYSSSVGFILDTYFQFVPDLIALSNVGEISENGPFGPIDIVSANHNFQNAEFLGFAASSEISYHQTQVSFIKDQQTSWYDGMLFEGLVPMDRVGRRFAPFSGIATNLQYAPDLSVYLSQPTTLSVPPNFPTTITSGLSLISLRLPNFTYKVILTSLDASGSELARIDYEVRSTVSDFEYESQFSLDGLLLPGVTQVRATVESFSGNYAPLELDVARPYWLTVMGLQGSNVPITMSQLSEMRRVKKIGDKVIFIPASYHGFESFEAVSGFYTMDESEVVKPVGLRTTDSDGFSVYMAPSDLTVGSDSHVYALVHAGNTSYIYRSNETWNWEAPTVNLTLLYELPIYSFHITALEDFILIPGTTQALSENHQTVIMRFRAEEGTPQVAVRELEISTGVMMTQNDVTTFSDGNNQVFMGLHNWGTGDTALLSISAPTQSSLAVEYVLENPLQSRGGLTTDSNANGEWQEFSDLHYIHSVVSHTTTEIVAILGLSGQGQMYKVAVGSITTANPTTRIYVTQEISSPQLRSTSGFAPASIDAVENNHAVYASGALGQILRIEDQSVKVISPIPATQSKATTGDHFVLSALHFREQIFRLIGVPDSSWFGDQFQMPPQNHWFGLTEDGQIFYWQVQSGIMMFLDYGFRFLDMKLDAQTEDRVFVLDELGRLYGLEIHTDPLRLELSPVLSVPVSFPGQVMRFEYAQDSDILLLSSGAKLTRIQGNQETLLVDMAEELSVDDWELSIDDIFMSDLFGNDAIATLRMGTSGSSLYYMFKVQGGQVDYLQVNYQRIAIHRHMGQALAVAAYEYGDWRFPNTLQYAFGTSDLFNGLNFSEFSSQVVLFTKNQNGAEMIGIKHSDAGDFSVLQRVPARVIGGNHPVVSNLVLKKSGNQDVIQMGDVFTVEVEIGNCQYMCLPVATLFHHPLHFFPLPNQEFVAEFTVGPREASYTQAGIVDLQILSINGLSRSSLTTEILFSENQISPATIVNPLIYSVSKDFEPNPSGLTVTLRNQGPDGLTGGRLLIHRQSNLSEPLGIQFQAVLDQDLRLVTIDSGSLVQSPMLSTEAVALELVNPFYTNVSIPKEIYGASRASYFVSELTTEVVIPLTSLGFSEFSGSIHSSCGGDVHSTIVDRFTNIGYVSGGRVLTISPNFVGTCTVTIVDEDPKKRTVVLRFVRPSPFVMEMNRVNPGQFIMGAPSGAVFQNSDEVERQVTLTQGFYLGKFEVTQKEWLTVMGSWPGNAPSELGDWLPAVNVSWTDINQVGGFLDQLNTMVGCDISSLPTDIVTRYNPVNVGPGCYRLPTAAEWEYAAKAGTNTLWSFGNDSAQADPYAWHLGNSSSTLKKVGQKLPNPWNFYDIHGNVGEFVFDRAGGDTSNPRTDPTGPDQYVGPNPMNRGGSYSNDVGFSRSAKPGNGGTDNRQNNLGFRLLRTLD